MSDNQIIAVIGGGAAGLMSAIAAGTCAQSVGIDRLSIVIYERQARVGKKILATGNGRCNLSNRAQEKAFYHGSRPDVYERTLEARNVEETLGFFQKLGIFLYEEEGRMYPYANQAAAVLDILRSQAAVLGVEERCQCEIIKISHHAANGPARRFVLTDALGRQHPADRVIVAGGGLAAPQLSGHGSAYTLLSETGHRLIPPFPTLTPLKTNPADVRGLKGLRVRGRLRLLAPDPDAPADHWREIAGQSGEALFTDYGLSGIAAMQLSRHIAGRQDLRLSLNLLPHYSPAELTRILHERTRRNAWMLLENFLVGIVPKRVGHMLLKYAAFTPLSRSSVSLSEQECALIASSLLDWRFAVAGTMGWEQAQATAGGIDLGDFAPHTMESRLARGLYAAGEMLDVDGDCGGYNLHWAWTSGYLAGWAAAESLK